MIKNKRIMATAMAVMLATTSVTIPGKNVEAKETTQEYVVMAKNDVGYEKVEDKHGEDIVETEELEQNNIVVVEITEREATKLENDGDILVVEKNISFEASGKKNKKSKKNTKVNSGSKKEHELKQSLKEEREERTSSINAEEQWNIDAINANEKEYEQVNDKIKVAVLDTGVTATEDIDVIGRVNFIDGEENVNPLYEDISGHGTSVASVIAAKENEIGVTGVNPNVELYSVKVLDDERKASLSDVIEGIYWCMDNDIDIINMSVGTSVKSEILQQVIQEADEQGILMVAAAGNQGEVVGESTVEYPAAFEQVIAVGATTPQGTTSDISSVGMEVELVAPGEMIPATGFFDEIIETEGTSMAAAHVTGVASILWAKDRSKSNDFVRKLMNVSAKKIGDEEKAGNGVIDLDYALSVYDEFTATYKEDGKENSPINENLEQVSVYDEAEISASWAWQKHQDAVGLYSETSDYEMSIIKIGAKIPDTKSYMKYNKGVTDSFHGHKNYVANYIYLMRMARICSKSGMSVALRDAKYPCSDEGKEQIYNGIVNLNKDWKSVLAGKTINNKNKARVLVGIATHVAMDVYAHKAYRKESNGSWNRIDIHDGSNPNIDYQDLVTHVPSRWTCAKDVAYYIIDVWNYNMEPDAREFYISAHDASKFRLYRLATYSKEADRESYNAFSGWFNKHSIKD